MVYHWQRAVCHLGCAMVSEKSLQDYLLKKAKFNNIYARKMQAIGHTGFPDMLIAVAGHVAFIELKTPKGTGVVSKKQHYEISLLERAGVPVFIMKSKEEIDDFINSIFDA